MGWSRLIPGILSPLVLAACAASTRGEAQPTDKEDTGEAAEPAVMLTPSKHFSGEPEYPVEGAPKLDLPPPWADDPSAPGSAQEPFEPPPDEPPEPDHRTGIDPYERGNPTTRARGITAVPGAEAPATTRIRLRSSAR
jgi:hypothetical protein